MEQPSCSVSGVGILHTNDRLYAKVSYLIECWQQADGTVRRDGVIDLDTFKAWQCCPCDEMTLVLETGEQVRISNCGEDCGHIAIEVHDPVVNCADQCARDRVATAALV